MSVLCRHCGLPEEEHHEFEVDMPPGCVCGPGEWDVAQVPPACEAYVGNGVQYCLTCEHDEACHGEAP